MQEKILLFSELFPPGKSSSGFNLLKRIKESGFKFDVIAGPIKDSFAKNTAMFRNASSAFNIYRTSLPLGGATEEDIRGAFITEAASLAKELLNANHYIALMSHSNDFASHLAAYEIKRERPETRWLASYGDPFGGNPYALYYPQNFPQELLEREKELLSFYDDIIVTNERQKELMLEYFGIPGLDGKFRVLPHCFDPSFFHERLYKNDKFIFSHIGMLYKHKRDSKPFIEAVEYLLGAWPQYKGKFQVNFIGAADSHIDQFIKIDGGEHVCALLPVSYEESLELMSDADALLLREADFSEDGLSYSPFFPGKLVDYLVARKPIIAVTMENGFVPDFARDYEGIYIACEDEAEKIAFRMKELIDGIISRPSSTPNLSTYASGHNFRQIIAAGARPKTLLVAGHKLNFIEPFLDYLNKNTDYNILIDQWTGHALHNESESEDKLNKADIIFCEWGLGNAVWYSKHKKPGQRLITRVHLQELKTNYLEGINWDNIDSVFTVSPVMYFKLIERLPFISPKLRIIHNLINYSRFKKNSFPTFKKLGVIGYIPTRKRIDLALELFIRLWKKDNSFELHIKGKQPKEYKWIQSDQKENDFYNNIFQKIELLPCKKNIYFEPFGSDIPEFLQSVDYVLSLSDFESFHMAVAEGMGCGCVPVIRNWEGADSIYPQEYIFSSLDKMENFILEDSKNINRDKISAYAKERFDVNVVAPQILELFK